MTIEPKMTMPCVRYGVDQSHVNHNADCRYSRLQFRHAVQQVGESNPKSAAVSSLASSSSSFRVSVSLVLANSFFN